MPLANTAKDTLKQWVFTSPVNETACGMLMGWFRTFEALTSTPNISKDIEKRETSLIAVNSVKLKETPEYSLCLQNLRKFLESAK